MIILYKKQKADHLDLKTLAKQLKDATDEEFSEFYLKKSIAQCIKECPYEDFTDQFYIDVII